MINYKASIFFLNIPDILLGQELLMAVCISNLQQFDEVRYIYYVQIMIQLGSKHGYSLDPDIHTDMDPERVTGVRL